MLQRTLAHASRWPSDIVQVNHPWSSGQGKINCVSSICLMFFSDIFLPLRLFKNVGCLFRSALQTCPRVGLLLPLLTHGGPHAGTWAELCGARGQELPGVGQTDTYPDDSGTRQESKPDPGVPKGGKREIHRSGKLLIQQAWCAGPTQQERPRGWGGGRQAAGGHTRGPGAEGRVDGAAGSTGRGPLGGFPLSSLQSLPPSSHGLLPTCVCVRIPLL